MGSGVGAHAGSWTLVAFVGAKCEGGECRCPLGLGQAPKPQGQLKPKSLWRDLRICQLLPGPQQGVGVTLGVHHR